MTYEDYLNLPLMPKEEEDLWCEDVKKLFNVKEETITKKYIREESSEAASPP